MARKMTDATGGGGGDLAAQLVSITDFAALTGLSAEWVRLRVNEGRIPKAARGKVALGPAIRGVEAYFAERLATAAEKEKDNTQNRYREARAKEIDQRIDRAMRDLIHIDEALLAMKIVTDLFSKECREAQKLTKITDPKLRVALAEDFAGIAANVATAHRRLAAYLRNGGPVPSLKGRD